MTLEDKSIDPELIQDKGSSPRVFESRDLFDKEKVIIIRHENNSYRLMITKQGKLILNK